MQIQKTRMLQIRWNTEKLSKEGLWLWATTALERKQFSTKQAATIAGTISPLVQLAAGCH